MSQVDPNLYVGACWNASNIEELKRANVGFVLSVAAEFPKAIQSLPSQIGFKHYSLFDNRESLLPKAVRAAYDIKQLKDTGAITLVHCAQGRSRSVSVALVYLMIEYQWPYEQALRHVVSKRNIARPNSSYASQLPAIEKKFSWREWMLIAEYCEP
jgi:atypical dual specificity phosphatase